jgi:hypothetical protein
MRGNVFFLLEKIPGSHSFLLPYLILSIQPGESLKYPGKLLNGGGP